MLVCRACNTRYDPGTRACPSCGRKSSSNASDSSSGDSGRLPPSRRTKPRLTPEVDLELTESSVLDDSSSGRPLGDSGSGRPLGDSASGPVAAPRRKTSRPVAVRRKPAPPPIEADADTDQVKMLLTDQPGLLEKGLGLYADEEGELLGADFATPVGSIDLLCRDRKGGFVVVHLPAPDEIEDSVSAMLRRMGWVRKHLADEGAEVRGVVVLEHLPEELAYAAAGVAGAIAFKGFKLALTFHDLGE